MILLKGAPVAKALTEQAKTISLSLPRRPKLAIFRIGADPAALSYEAGAASRMQKAEIETVIKALPESVTEEEALTAFKALNDDPAVDGILMLYPFPEHISETPFAAAMDPEKDVDCMTDKNQLALYLQEPGICPCTPEAVLELLRYYEIPVYGRHAVVVGRSNVVGKPLSMMLLKDNATVTVCHSKTADLRAITSQADILVSAMGKARKLGKFDVKEGVIAVDVGLSPDADGNLAGDLDFDAVSERAAAITPVPGGVGSVTSSVLALHTAKACRKKLTRA